MMERQSDKYKSKKTNLILYAVILFLSLLLVANICRMCERDDDFHPENVVSDTVIVVKQDTIREEITRFVSEKVQDTIYLDTTSKNCYKLPIKQRMYADDDYKIWISGYEPILDSVVLFPKTEYRYITNDVTRYKELKKWSIYLDGGVLFHDRNVCSPFVGLRFNTPRRFSFGVGVAYIDHNVGIGLNLGIKIF